MSSDRPPAQLTAGVASAVLHDLGLHQVGIVGVAKGPERKPGLEELVLESESRSLQLPPSHPGLHLIQQIRDEAHRFAIVGHRARRAKARTTSLLAEIPGIGSKRRQALLEHFGGTGASQHVQRGLRHVGVRLPRSLVRPAELPLHRRDVHDILAPGRRSGHRRAQPAHQNERRRLVAELDFEQFHCVDLVDALRPTVR